MDIFSSAWQSICDFLEGILKWLVDLLPDSPFTLLSNSPFSEYLPYINYFVDFQFIIDTLTLWLVAVAGYYTYSAFLRMLNTVD